MKSYHLSSKSIAGILALACVFSGCTDEETNDDPQIPVSISASFPAYTGISTRAGNSTVRIALNTEPGGYAASSKTYQVTSASPITFATNNPDDPLKISESATSTPLTVYGWLDENTPVYYTNTAKNVSDGNITGVSLSPAYACIGVRIKKNEQTEAAGSYTIGSQLAGIGTYSTNNNWNTDQSTPKLEGSSFPSNIKNTNKTSVSGASPTEITSEYFMRVAPQNVSANFASLFTVALPDGTTLTVPSTTTDLSIEAGHCYLFTVNISREATLTIAGVEVTQINNRVNITAVPGGYGVLGIYSLEDLKAFRDAVNNDDSTAPWKENGVVNLYMDIDLKNEEWIPIKEFSGTFDGNGHTISNLNISDNAEINGLDHVGFFCNADQNSIIKGLTINGATISGTKHPYFGVIAGTSTGSIIDCHVKGLIQIESYCTGGIVGFYDGNNKTNTFFAACTTEATAGSYIRGNAGCIVGRLGANSIVVGCIAHDISLSKEEGVLAAIAGETNNAIILACLMYNCQADNTNNTIAVTNNMENCYSYNVFGINDEHTVESLSAFSESTFIKNLNDYMFAYGFEYYYTASSTPTETGPTIHAKL